MLQHGYYLTAPDGPHQDIRGTLITVLLLQTHGWASSMAVDLNRSTGGLYINEQNSLAL